MSATLIHVKDPFHPGFSREHFSIQPGDLLTDLAPDTTTPFIILVNGEAKLRDTWSYQVKANDLVVVVYLPRGGRGGSNPLRIVAMLAVAVMAPYLSGLIQGTALGANLATFAVGNVTYGNLLTAAIGIAGTALVNVLLPPAKLPSSLQNNSLAAPSPTYSLNAQGNSARLEQAIPVQYGRMIAYPDFAAQPYTEYAGNEQYLFQLLCLGQGEYKIESIRIEDTAIDNFDEIEYEVIEPNGTVTLFPTNVVSSVEIAGQELLSGSYIGPFILNAAGTQINAVAFDIVLPRGLYYFAPGGTLNAVSLTIQLEVREIDDDGVAIGSWVNLGIKTYTAKTTTPQRYSERFDITLGRYEIRATRTDTKQTDSAYGHEVVWSGARGYMPETRDFGNVTLIAMRMKASNNLSQLASRRINIISTRKLPIWNGSTWSAPTVTNSIAWALADAAKNTVYGGNLTDARIDLATLLELDSLWSSRDDTFNGRFDNTLTFWEAISQIAITGRTKPYMQGGILRFTRDGAQATPIALYSMRNIIKGSFALEYLLPTDETADAVAVSYFDGTFWAPRRVLANLPTSSAERPVKMDLFGVTNRDQAYREGVYQAASNKYRRKLIKFRTEMEGFIPSLGDLIAIQHDMPAWGQHAEVVSTEFAQNDLRRSGGFPNTLWWIRAGIGGVSANVTTTPDGKTNADKLYEDTSNTHYLYQNIDLIAGMPYVGAIYVKAVERTKMQLRLGNANMSSLSERANATFDLSTGTVVSSSVPESDRGIIDMGDGWYRVWVRATAVGTGVGYFFIYLADASGNIVYTGDGSSGIYIWGAQMSQTDAVGTYVHTKDEPASATVLNLSDELEFNSDGVSTHYIGMRNKDGSILGPYEVTWAAPKAVAFDGSLPVMPYTGNDYERTHITFGWSETWRQEAKVISIKPLGLYEVEIEAINEDPSVHTAEIGLIAPPIQTSQLTTLYTKPVIADLVLRSSASDTSKALLTWTPAPGASSYQIEMSSGTDPYATDLEWTRVGETSASNFAVTALYGAQTLIRVRAIGLAVGPWVTLLFGENADYMWVNSTDLMWDANSATLMWRY